ncbi:MAG TPA: hypothetical protein ENJ37_08640 [Deltaproteobacteria bacterium]|nr:hypothetical protein [Deltaproteobacteria bacterium]
MRRGLTAGLAAGAVWGVVSFAAGAVSGIFEYESGVVHNLAAFAVAGSLFGAVTGGFLALLYDRLPAGRGIVKAVVVSTLLWLLLRIGGSLLSAIEPMRYHGVTAETMQGLVLAAVLGVLVGVFWEKGAAAEKA